VSPLVALPWCHLVVPAGCHIASCSPLIAPPSRCLVVLAGCCIASCRPLIALPSCRLVAPAGCCIASHHPLIAHTLVNSSHQLVVISPLLVFSLRPVPPAALLSIRRAGWLLRRLSTCHPIVVLSSHHAASCCFIAPAGCRTIISHCPLIAPPSLPLIVLAGCCVACPCTAFLSSRRSPSPTPSNAAECCCRHQTPRPLPPINAISIVHFCHSCRPSPQSNANAHLCPFQMPTFIHRHC